MLKRFSIEYPKRVNVHMSNGITLPKSMCPKTQDERTCMSMTPYALAIGLIMYTMLFTKPDVSFALRVIRKY